MNRVGMLVAVVAVIAVAVVGVGMLVNYGLPGFLSWASADSPEKARAAAMDGRERVFREQFKLSDECVKAALEATKAPTTKSHSKDGKSHIEKWSFSCGSGKQTVLLTETDCKYVWTLAKPAAKAVAPPAPAPVPAPPAVAAPPAPQAPAVSQEVRVNVGSPDAAPRVAVTESPQAPSTVRQVVQVNVAGSPPVTVAAPVPPVVPPPPAPVAMAPAGPCPDGWQIIANVWSLAALPSAMNTQVTSLASAATSRDSRNATDAAAYRADDVSRTLGGRLRREVVVRAPLTLDIPVFYRDPQTKGQRKLGVLRVVGGTGSMKLPDDPRKMIVETIWPKDSISPAESAGDRRLWLFPEEWGSWCAMNVHGVVP